MNDNVFSVKVKRRAFKALEQLSREYRLRVLEVLDELSTNPIPFKRYDFKEAQRIRGHL